MMTQQQRITAVVVLAIAGLATCLAIAVADAPSAPLMYSGTVERNGVRVTGPHNVELELWSAADGGNLACPSQAQDVDIDDGRFTVTLTGACADALRTTAELYTFVKLDGEGVGKRARVGAAPIALSASHAVQGSDLAQLIPQIEMGTVRRSYTDDATSDPSWKELWMPSATGDRVFPVPVKFEKPFASPPRVLCALSAIDASPARAGSSPALPESIRVQVYASDIRPDGFTLNMKTWALTSLYAVGALWIAQGERKQNGVVYGTPLNCDNDVLNCPNQKGN